MKEIISFIEIIYIYTDFEGEIFLYHIFKYVIDHQIIV